MSNFFIEKKKLIADIETLKKNISYWIEETNKREKELFKAKETIIELKGKISILQKEKKKWLILK